jgi:hypothetical protein
MFKKEGKIFPVLGVDNSDRREDIRKGFRMVNMVEILFTYI